MDSDFQSPRLINAHHMLERGRGAGDHERLGEGISISLTRISKSEVMFRMFQGRRLPNGRSEFFKCTFEYRTCNRGSAAGKAHAFENFPFIDGWMDRSKNFQTTVALGVF